MSAAPLDIVTLVPAFKPAYLADLLNSLRLQTRPSSRVIFSDDSPNGEYRAALFSDAYAPLRDGLAIECHDGPRRGGWPNMLRLLEIWDRRSPLVHLMLDDDVIYPDFYERHLVAHASARFSVSVSRRWSASNSGQPIAAQPVPPAVANAANRLLSLDAGFVFATTAAECCNWLGEFSNAVFARDAAAMLSTPSFDGVPYAGLWDLGAFMAASRVAPVAYIQDHLGYFRTGGQGHSAQFFGPYMKAAYLGFAALALGGRRLGMYDDAQVRHCCATLAQAVAQLYGAQADMQLFVPLLRSLSDGDDGAEAAFVGNWQAFLRQHDFY